MNYMGRAEFSMPRNYPVSRHYPLLSEEENRRRVEESQKRIPEIAGRIKDGKRLQAMRIRQNADHADLRFDRDSRRHNGMHPSGVSSHSDVRVQSFTDFSCGFCHTDYAEILSDEYSNMR